MKVKCISLSKLLLASLYQSLGESSYKLKHLLETNKSFLASGPLWTLHFLLNAIFKPNLHITTSLALISHDDCIATKGTRLSLTTPQETPSQKDTYEIHQYLPRINHFSFDNGPFRGLMWGLSWFKNRYP